MTVSNAVVCLKDLEQLEFGIRVKNQQHPCGQESGTTGRDHELKRRCLAADLQGEELTAAGLVEFHRPILRAAAVICCATEKDFEFVPVQSLDADRELHSLQWMLISSKQQAESALRLLRPIIP